MGRTGTDRDGLDNGNGTGARAPARTSDPTLDPVARLAATHAALSRERRAWRYDILVSAIVQVLDLYGPRTLDQLQGAIGRLWGARLSFTLLEDALRVAREAHLVHTEQRLDEREWWVLAEGARPECAADRAVVEEAFHAFADDLYREVADHVDGRPVPAERALRLAGQMFAAAAAATSGSHQVAGLAGAGSPSELRPARLDLGILRSHLREHVRPRHVARAMEAAALKLVDPEHPLGSQVLHLLVVGNMAQCLLTSRDLHGMVDVSQHRILLDTSALVALAEEDTPQRRLFDELVATSVAAGVEVVVPEHVLDEWERLWGAADHELRSGSEPAWASSRNAYTLVRNPIVRGYLHTRRDRPGMSWAAFQVGRRDLRHRLEQAGVRVRPHGNRRPDDVSLVEGVERRLLELSADPRIAAARTEAAARADAHSCAMVARWRAKHPMAPPCGWVIGTDTLTDHAYRQVAGVENRYPLSMTPTAWMLYLSSVVTHDGDSVRALLHTLSDAVTRESFLATVSAYAFEEVCGLAEVLAGDDGSLSEDDVRAAIEVDVLEMVREADERSDSAYLREVGVATLRRRSARREERAARAHDRADQREQDLEAREREVREEVWAQARRRYAWLFGGIVAGVAFAGGVTVGLVTGALPVWAAVAGACGTVVVADRIHDHLRRDDASLLGLVLTVAATLAVTVLGAALTGRW